MQEQHNGTGVRMTVDVVASYVSANAVPASALPGLIATIHGALEALAKPPVVEDVPLVPAVSIKKSITDEFMICLEDGKKYRSLKRHLRTAFGLSPMEYRQKWGLPSDYPMVAPAYAAKRSVLAKEMQLGKRGLNAQSAVAIPAAVAPTAPVLMKAPATAAVNGKVPARKRGRPAKKAA